MMAIRSEARIHPITPVFSEISQNRGAAFASAILSGREFIAVAQANYEGYGEAEQSRRTAALGSGFPFIRNLFKLNRLLSRPR
jgi:hypothetical protein